jgi:hypothetical protein
VHHLLHCGAKLQNQQAEEEVLQNKSKTLRMINVQRRYHFQMDGAYKEKKIG